MRRVCLHIIFFCATSSIVLSQKSDSIVPVNDTIVPVIDSNAVLFDSLSTYDFPPFHSIDTSLHSKYPFIDFGKNNYAFYTKGSPNFELFYSRFKEMLDERKGKLNMYHIGGSHLQADIYTHDARTFLQSNWYELAGERGWVFPFDLAKTNNPGNYDFKSPNKWRGYSSVSNKTKRSGIDFGVLGETITCNDSAIIMYFRHDYTKVKPPFNHIRVFHNKGEFPYEVNMGLDEILVTKMTHNEELGCTDIYFCDDIETFDIQFARKGYHAPELEIYGFLLMNDHPGISYTSIGINGAGLYTYLANSRFEEQLKTYPPDFFAFSVGTNDGNVPNDRFNPQVYKNNLEKMMQMVLRANPDCALLLTVPNDSYYHRKYLNKNIAKERTVIIELAQQYEMAVWDLYGLMGELGSSKTWKNNKLMRGDLVHFTNVGYHLKGDIYIDGFLKFLDQMEIYQNSEDFK